MLLKNILWFWKHSKQITLYIMNYLILKRKLFSKNNSAYWLGKKYIGIAFAHSYDGVSFWNIANNTLYIKALTLMNSQTLKYYQRLVITNILWRDYARFGAFL
jgi:hypothetical protein